MNLFDNIRSWLLHLLRAEPAQPRQLSIQEHLTFADNAAVNRIWYGGEPEELRQLYAQIGGTGFWAMSAGSHKIQRIHTGLPGEIVDTLARLITADMLGVEIDNHPVQQEILNTILEENHFQNLLEEAVSQVIVIGDGAFRLTFDKTVSELPVIEFIPGDRVLYRRNAGRITEMIFCTCYLKNGKEFVLQERYGYGFVRYVLTDRSGVPVSLDTLEETKGLDDLDFDDRICLAVPMLFQHSKRYPGRGSSLFDRKRGSFDALDEAWSQWMHAVRKSHVQTYVPSSIAGYDPHTGEPQKPDDFEDSFIVLSGSMGENSRDQIVSVQPHIEHEGYLAAYMTALDLCLQGMISPSTLGIDVKKLDNAEAQREKEKTTLYTRNRIVTVLQNILPDLFQAVLWLYAAVHESEAPENLHISVPFGEYANPSFEAQVETMCKAKTARAISNQALVDELYGDTRTDEWKAEETARLDAMDGLVQSGEDLF